MIHVPDAWRLAARVAGVSGAGVQSARHWRGWLLTSLLLVGVQGCTQLSRSSLDMVKLATQRHTLVAPTAAEVATRPYFQLQVTSANARAVLILGNVDGAREAWYGAHGVAVFIAHGRVVKTTGLSQNLDGLQLPATDPFTRGLHTLTAPVTYRLTADWSPGYRYGVPVEATLTLAGATQISILDTTHPVQRVDEQLSVPALHYRATNHYWVDPEDGFIWKSEQQVAPGLTLQLVQLRPYRKTQP